MNRQKARMLGPDKYREPNRPWDCVGKFKLFILFLRWIYT